MTARFIHPLRSERGETLPELMVTVAILGIAIVVIVGGLADGILASDAHRQHATLDANVRSVAECIKDRTLWQSNGNYDSSCPRPSGVTAAPSCWNGTGLPGSSGSFGSCPGPDSGLQQIVVTGETNNGRASEKMTIWKRRS
jgi:prepilin-type N-terminal cleavage/methylation domain-containing protein